MIVVSAAALLAGAVLVALALPKTADPAVDLRTPPTSYDAGIADGTTLGAASAPVVMQLYADFQCPACKLFVTTQLADLVDRFVATETLRIEAVDIAFLGRGAFDESLELAVGAACAAEQGRYWQFHDTAFWNQGRENKGDHGAAFIAGVADAAMVDRAAWDTCITRSDVRSSVVASTSAALAAGIDSTPTLVVNGRQVVGVPQYDQLAALIDQLAAEASASSAPAQSPSPRP